MRPTLAILVVVVGSMAGAALRGDAPMTSGDRPAGFDFIDTGFENASPLWYEVTEDGAIRIHLLYDHERSSPNRAAGHVHFLVHAKPGTRLTIEFTNLDNIYNGRPGSVAREMQALVVSADGREWKPRTTRSLPGNRVLLDVEMVGPKLYVARVEPYRLTDLESWLASIGKRPQVAISPIGKTVEGRDLEIVTVGDAGAPYRVFLRARAHPWEAGGNWVIQGLVNRLLQGDAASARFLKRYCVHVMPMANKDGVVRGRTRFNLQGKDLNRNWDQPADARTAPENHALEAWLQEMIRKGQRPHLALELHNDGNGKVHVSQPPVTDAARYLERMKLLEALLRKHTWFTEGVTRPAIGVGTLSDGWLHRYGVDAVVHEFNCHWIAGLKVHPTRREWERYGSDLAEVLHEYFAQSLR